MPRREQAAQARVLIVKLAVRRWLVDEREVLRAVLAFAVDPGAIGFAVHEFTSPHFK
jgi:hypothetical protein